MRHSRVRRGEEGHEEEGGVKEKFPLSWTIAYRVPWSFTSSTGKSGLGVIHSSVQGRFGPFKPPHSVSQQYREMGRWSKVIRCVTRRGFQP